MELADLRGADSARVYPNVDQIGSNLLTGTPVEGAILEYDATTRAWKIEAGGQISWTDPASSGVNMPSTPTWGDVDLTAMAVSTYGVTRGISINGSGQLVFTNAGAYKVTLRVISQSDGTSNSYSIRLASTGPVYWPSATGEFAVLPTTPNQSDTFIFVVNVQAGDTVTIQVSGPSGKTFQYSNIAGIVEFMHGI